MKNYSPQQGQVQREDPKLLNRRYIRKDKPWHDSNKRYSFLLKEIRRRYYYGYLGILSEQLKTSEAIQSNSYRRGPRRKLPSDNWHPFS